MGSQQSSPASPPLMEDVKQELNAHLAYIEEQNNLTDDKIEGVHKKFDSLKAELVKQPDGGKAVANSIAKVAKSVRDNVDDLRSGDRGKVLKGSLAISECVLSQISHVAGPAGAAICGVISTITAFCAPNQAKLAAVMQEIVNEAFRDYEDRQLRADAGRALYNIRMRNVLLTSWSDTQLNDRECGALQNLLTDLDYATVHTLSERIKTMACDSDEKMAKRAVQYVMLYIDMSKVLRTCYTNLALAMEAHGMPGLRKGVKALFDQLEEDHRDTLRIVCQEPGAETRCFYRDLHFDLCPQERQSLTEFLASLGLLMPGDLCRIFNDKQQKWLAPWDRASLDNDRRGLAVVAEGGLFRVFGPKHKCRIYSVEGAAYMYAADYKPEDDDRRNVWLWAEGRPLNRGKWDIRDGKLFNLWQQEYMYAADFKAGFGYNRVWTWRPRNMVKQGYWTIHNVDYNEQPLHAVSSNQHQPHERSQLGCIGRIPFV